MKCVICMSVQLNIICLICISRQYPQNYIEFDNDTRVFLITVQLNTVKQGRSLTLYTYG